MIRCATASALLAIASQRPGFLAPVHSVLAWPFMNTCRLTLPAIVPDSENLNDVAPAE